MGDFKGRPITENVLKLVTRFAAVKAVPKDGGFVDAIAWLQSDGMRADLKRSVVDAFTIIDAVKNAPDNPYGDDDDTIAKVIIDEVEKRG